MNRQTRIRYKQTWNEYNTNRQVMIGYKQTGKGSGTNRQARKNVQTCRPGTRYNR